MEIFIHHGTEDEIIPYSHAVSLGVYGHLQSYQGADHNNLRWRRRLVN